MGLVLALVAPGLALGMRQLPPPDLGPPYLLFVPPILLAALLGGPWYGIASTATTTFLAGAWVLGGAGPPTPRDAVSLAAFVMSGLLVSLLAHRHARARDRAAAAEHAAALQAASARHELEAAARVDAERRRLAVTLQSIGDAVIATDVEGRITDFNAVAARLTGWTPAEALGRPLGEVFRIVAEDSGAPREDPAARVLRDGVVIELANHTALLPRDGPGIPIADSAAPIRTAAGEITGVVLVFRDQSEARRLELARREHERAIEAREHHLRAIVETAIDAFLLIDEEGRLLQVNGAAALTSGYSREELLAMRLADLEVQLDQPEIRRRIADVLAREHDRFESRHRCKDGRIIDVEIALSRPDRSRAELVCFARDITAEKQAREALRRSEERLRALIEKSTDMILVLDAEARITFWSANAAQTMGWGEEQVLGQRALEWIHPEDRARITAQLGRLLARPGERDRALFRHRRPDGTYRHVDTHARNLLDDPAVRGVVVNARDVSEQLALEQQLRQAQRLESVGRLAGGVAHDFNNLLTVILSGAAELRSAPGDREAVAEIAVEVRAAGERARELTQQLLAFARKQVIAPVTLDLGDVVRGTEKLLRRLLREDIVLSTDLAPGLWPVRCDPGQVEQIIVNLAVNARDAMPAGGRLALSTSNLEVAGGDAVRTGLPPGRWVRLAVSDDGEGMTPEVRERVFEPFFTTKDKSKGTGLGLSTVYGIVTQSGGAIRVESEPGCGATFDVFLPVAAPQVTAAAGAGAASAPVERTAGAGDETVLVVEDDAQVRGVTVRVLRSAGYRVLVAAGGEEALALSAREPGLIQLLLTDMVMPGLGGRAVATQLTAARPEARVLYVSGYTRDVIDERGELEPGVEFLPKPFTPTDLLARVRSVLDRGGRVAGA